MSSPIPPDPYEALGVARDADLSTIRSAHRKLVLKFHPDRIKDEAEKERGRDKFQKVQQAFELLYDSDRRSRYDDRIKLAALRREAMTRDSPIRPTNTSYSMPMRPAPPISRHGNRRDFGPEDDFSSRQSFTGGGRDRYKDEPSRGSSRKYDIPSERKRRTSTEASKSTKLKKSSWDTGTLVMSVENGLKFQAKARQARDRMEKKKLEMKEQDRREKELIKEKKAAKARIRDQEQVRDGLEKPNRHVYIEDDSSSDSITATQVTDATIRGSLVETVRRSSNSSLPMRRMIRGEVEQSSERSRRDIGNEDDDDEYADPWEERHKSAATYMVPSGHRPTLGRSESFWQSKDRSRSSDSDTCQTTSRGRRANLSSSPANLWKYVEERAPRDIRDPQRSAGDSSVLPEQEQERRREMPSFTRSKTVPSGRSSAKKNITKTRTSTPTHRLTETKESLSDGPDLYDTRSYNSKSPRRRAPSMCSRQSSRNGSLRGDREFDRDYQTPTFSRSRAGSGAGSACSYEIPKARRGLPPPPNLTKTKYQIVDPTADDEYSRPSLGRRPTVALDDEDRHHRFMSPERRTERPERPRIVTSDRSKSSRVASSKIESSLNKPHDIRRASGRRSSIASPLVSRQNRGRHDSQEDRDYVPAPQLRENVFVSRRASDGPASSSKIECLPAEDDASPLQSQATCYVCGTGITIKRRRDWQVHLIQDLEPYICFIKDCPSASNSYVSCNDLLLHVQTMHPSVDILDANGDTVICPFCDEPLPGNVRKRFKHLGRHMEEIAFAIVPNNIEDWSFYNDSDMANETDGKSCTAPAKTNAGVSELKPAFSELLAIPPKPKPSRIPRLKARSIAII